MSSKRPESLRSQLLRWLLVPLLALLIANAWFSNRAAVAIADEAFDRLLLASAEAIGDDIDVRDGKVVSTFPTPPCSSSSRTSRSGSSIVSSARTARP